jgi:hypothetical protein
MAIDRFTTEKFEQALLTPKGQKAFEYIGLIDGERCYAHTLKTCDHIRIVVRSSIDSSGIAADTGEDSIRLILQRMKGNKWQNIGKGIDAYTTRVPGWDRRLKEKITLVARKAARIVKPFTDDDNINFCSNGGPNEGRPFASGPVSSFRWLDNK